MSDFTVGDTLYHHFSTRAFATGIPTTLIGTPVAEAYEDASDTGITAGVSLTIDHAETGHHLLTVVATGGNGFETAKTYGVSLTAGTVGGVSVVGEVIFNFTLGRSAAAVDLANGTDGLGVLKSELDGIQADTEDIQNRIPAALSNGMMDANVERWLDTAAAAPNTAGVPLVDVARLNGDNSGANALSRWMSSGANGSADSGDTTTMVDTARTEANDVWNGSLIVFTSGAIAGQCRLITDFDAASDTTTFTPAVTTGVTTEAYAIIPWPGADVQVWRGTAAVVGAIPAAAADAAGGLPISDNGGLDLDTQLAATNEITAARMGALTDWINGGRLDLLLDAIKVPTDKMVFSKANELDANTKSINDAEVIGDGNATPWDGV